MKIELEIPFKNDYKAGYIVTNKEPRRTVILVNNLNQKTSLSYARYLMSCNLKRYLSKEEHVDHIDGNKLNDVIDNLQILSLIENNRKSIIQNNKQSIPVKGICPICNKVFYKEPRQMNFKLKNGKKPCCSRKCGYIQIKKNRAYSTKASALFS